MSRSLAISSRRTWPSGTSGSIVQPAHAPLDAHLVIGPPAVYAAHRPFAPVGGCTGVVRGLRSVTEMREILTWGKGEPNMQIYRDTISEKLFLLITGKRGGKALMVSPEGEVKTLQLERLDYMSVLGLKGLVAAELLTETQIKIYYEYTKDQQDIAGQSN